VKVGPPVRTERRDGEPAQAERGVSRRLRRPRLLTVEHFPRGRSQDYRAGASPAPAQRRLDGRGTPEFASLRCVQGRQRDFFFFRLPAIRFYASGTSSPRERASFRAQRSGKNRGNPARRILVIVGSSSRNLWSPLARIIIAPRRADRGCSAGFRCPRKW